MLIGLLVSFCIGWLFGGLGNWLADQLPHLPAQPLRFVPAQYSRALMPFGGEAHTWRQPLLTVGMAAAFTIGWWRFEGDWGQLLVAWFYTVWLLVVVVIDLEHRRVLNVMLPSAIVVTLVAPLLTLVNLADLPTFTNTLLGGLAGFVSFFVIFLIGRGRMMGAGDVKLAGVIGLMVGYPLVWGALAAGIILGGLAAIFILVRSRASGKSYMAYGPYLALGALLVMWLYWPF